MIDFFGKLHPLILHLPIGLIAGLAVFEILSFKSDCYEKTRKILCIFSTIGFIFATLAGLALANSGGYSGDVFENHKLFCLILTGVSITGTVFFLKGFEKIYRGFFCGILLLLPIAGHFGGILTHGADWLKMPWEKETSKIEVISEKKDLTKVSDVFRDVIYPIFKEKCIRCHGPDKQKSGWRLDSLEEAMKKGESGEKGVIKGDILKSNLIRVILFPPEHDLAMPPEGKKQLTADEKLQIIEWVRQL